MGAAAQLLPASRTILELPSRVESATGIRSALLQSSLAVVDRLGLTQRYYAELTPDEVMSIRGLVVGQWNPMALGVAHYRAIDSLGLTPQQSKENGKAVAEKVQVGFAGIVFRGIGTAVTPIDALKRTPAFFERLMQGGGAVGLVQRGPKDARVEIVGIPIGQFEYVRNAWAGMFEATLGLLTHRTFVRNVSNRGGERVLLDVSWV